ncbi:Tetratricopeptide repeat protein [Rubripirellula obstinata]|uniref:Tetratricopeptide repeat protein n=1 Tax=Rubripirellula obstinata TaxID=406547 RepID=A0A5B1CAM9_9BACT|nr:hypothetical protein [Rubripirellula obstinata]KAA1258187.1 Tetratricopeptide repeat protein [Rubripirellula obstinata]
MIVKLIHRPESAFRFYLDDTLDRFEHRIKHGDFPEDDEREEERLELYEMLSDQQRLDVWGLSADLYSLLDEERPPNCDTKPSPDEVATRLQVAYDTANWRELVCVLRYQDGMMERSVVDYMRYRAWAELGYPEVAFVFLKNAIRLDPADSGYKHLALELLKKMKDWDSLASLAEKYVSDCPEDAGVLLAAGEACHDLAINTGNKTHDERAVEYLKRGLEQAETLEARQSQSASAVVTLAFALLNLGQTDEATSALDQWLQEDSRNPELHAARGIVHLTNDYSLAIEDFKQAVTLRTKSVIAYLEYANWLLHEGMHDQAIVVASDGLQFAARASDRSKVRHLMALGYAMSDRPHQAIYLMREAKQLNPTDRELALNMRLMQPDNTDRNGVSAVYTLPPRQTRNVNELLRQVAA